MSEMPPPPPPPRQTPPRSNLPFGKRKNSDGGANGDQKSSMPRWVLWLILAVVVFLAFGSQLWDRSSGEEVTYTEFLALVDEDKVDNITINNSSNSITGDLKDEIGRAHV